MHLKHPTDLSQLSPSMHSNHPMPTRLTTQGFPVAATEASRRTAAAASTTTTATPVAATLATFLMFFESDEIAVPEIPLLVSGRLLRAQVGCKLLCNNVICAWHGFGRSWQPVPQT